MDLSIIIISWNTQQILRECLESVYAHGEDVAMQVVVVDNASTDGSAQMVRDAFPQVELIVNTDNRGFAAANNQGFAVARGRYVLLLNSDTVILDAVLKESVRYMDTHDAVGVLGCRVLNPDRTLQLTCSREPNLANLLLLTTGLWKLNWPRWLGRYQMKHWRRDSERDVQVVSGCYMVVRRSAMDAVGVLDEAFFFFGEETDWCTRFRKADWHVRFAPVGEIVHYGSASAASLGHQRDLLLTQGLVRYNAKQHGQLAGMAVWGLLFGFGVSRWLFWWLRSLVFRDASTRDRRDHFKSVIHEYRKAWPTRLS